MRIGINARLLIQNRLEGMGWHAFELITRLTQAHPDHQFYLYYDRNQDILVPPGKNIIPVVLFPPSRHPLLMWWWCKVLARAVRKEGLDVFYSPEVLMPPGLKIPVLITIHDLSPMVLSKSLPRSHAYYYRHMLPLNAKAAQHIFTVSQFSKSEIEHRLTILPEKISVVYNAARTIFKPLEAQKKQEIRNQYSHGCPYFIYLGSIHNRKNVDQIIHAFEGYIQTYQSRHYLVLAGKFMGTDGKARQAIRESQYANRILHPGYVDDSLAAALLASADVMINLSEYEGFGMPLVESFQSGTPVIASNTSCYPEIAGQAAILVDPRQIDSIITALHQAVIAPDPLLKSGYERAKLFDWQNSAAQIWESIWGWGTK